MLPLQGGLALLPRYGSPDVQSIELTDRGVFANPGAWLDQPRFLRFTPESLELCRWTDAGRVVESALAREPR